MNAINSGEPALALSWMDILGKMEHSLDQAIAQLDGCLVEEPAGLAVSPSSPEGEEPALLRQAWIHLVKLDTCVEQAAKLVDGAEDRIGAAVLDIGNWLAATRLAEQKLTNSTRQSIK